MSSPRWIAFLRAANVGTRRLPSTQLREVCTGVGLRDVRTHLQTGNVSFAAPPDADRATLARDLRATLEAAAGFEVPVMVRDVALLQAALDPSPFAAIEITAQTRLFVLVLGAPLPAEPPLPFATATGDVRIVSATEGEAFVVALHGTRVPNTTAIVERAFGVVATGRFEHTLHRILASAA